jgi:hypothetical protein
VQPSELFNKKYAYLSLTKDDSMYYHTYNLHARSPTDFSSHFDYFSSSYAWLHSR